MDAAYTAVLNEGVRVYWGYERYSFNRVVLFGTVFVFGVGAGCHFLYEASGCNFVVGLLVAVNESVFEHVKLIILSILLFWIFESILPLCLFDSAVVYRVMYQNVTGAAVALLCGMLVMVGVYLFTFVVLGFEQLWFDIFLFFLSSFAAQLSGWMISRYTEPGVLVTMVCGVVLVSAIVCHVYFTDNPLHVDMIFKDPRGFYGRSRLCGDNHTVPECCS